MSDASKLPVPAASSFVDRVINSDTAKKGLAGAAAAILVAVITEAIWPSES